MTDKQLQAIKLRAAEIFRALAVEIDSTRTNIPTLPKEELESDEGRRHGISKKNLHEAGLLTSQVLSALERDHVLLALIGTRTLLENFFNSKYAFDHPDYKKDLKWTYQVCNDYYESGNNPKSKKSELNGESIYGRAKAVGEEALYQTSYAGLCNYSHPKIHGVLAYKGEGKLSLSADVYGTIIPLLFDVLTLIREHYDMKPNEDLRAIVIEFSEKLSSERD